MYVSLEPFRGERKVSLGSRLHVHNFNCMYYVLVCPFTREWKGLVISLYLCCAHVWNVDMANQITVWSST